MHGFVIGRPFGVEIRLHPSVAVIVFLIGLLVFGEQLNPAQLACYVMIWLAVAIFVWDMFDNRRKARAVRPAAS